MPHFLPTNEIMTRPKALLRLSSKIFGSSDVIEENNGDAFAAHQRKCVHTMFVTKYHFNPSTRASPILCNNMRNGLGRGLNEYIGANLNLVQQYATSIHSQTSNASMSKSEFVDSEMQDEFYDAISAESLSSDEESDEDMELDQRPLSSNYFQNGHVIGGDPLLKLIVVDWLKVDKSIDKIALHHRSLVQGYWMVKRVVGTKACLLGKAVTSPLASTTGSCLFALAHLRGNSFDQELVEDAQRQL
ncbi:hypothetical protein JHK86_024667 [Glycine max]|nr:hypothetical protein JHK86_024667 [Glycine max]